MLSTQVKNRVIVFHDKTAKYITEQEEAFLFSKAVTDRGLGRIGTKDDYEIVNLKNIAKIISSDEYSRLYPDKTSTRYEDYTGRTFKWEEQDDRGLREMAKGLRKFIEKGGTTGKAEETLRKMELKLETNLCK